MKSASEKDCHNSHRSTAWPQGAGRGHRGPDGPWPSHGNSMELPGRNPVLASEVPCPAGTGPLGLPLRCVCADWLVCPRVALCLLAGGPELGQGSFLALGLRPGSRVKKASGRAGSRGRPPWAWGDVPPLSCLQLCRPEAQAQGRPKPGMQSREGRSQGLLQGGTNLASIKASFRAAKPFPYVGLGGSARQGEGRQAGAKWWHRPHKPVACLGTVLERVPDPAERGRRDRASLALGG